MGTRKWRTRLRNQVQARIVRNARQPKGQRQVHNVASVRQRVLCPLRLRVSGYVCSKAPTSAHIDTEVGACVVKCRLLSVTTHMSVAISWCACRAQPHQRLRGGQADFVAVPREGHCDGSHGTSEMATLRHWRIALHATRDRWGWAAGPVRAYHVTCAAALGAAHAVPYIHGTVSQSVTCICSLHKRFAPHWDIHTTRSMDLRSCAARGGAVMYRRSQWLRTQHSSQKANNVAKCRIMVWRRQQTGGRLTKHGRCCACAAPHLSLQWQPPGPTRPPWRQSV